ncbi:hypothetical protein BXY75_1761 [Ulvibacter antarcticus]|uniref:Uncharacterized protein n=1 Tax=Ulvibacter antarcticus TaxID=442714 RepID=A0A3L9YW23_9FLAO|nr:hypothetical protein BXY75_1761 [Ulvibacter antarcticus]
MSNIDLERTFVKNESNETIYNINLPDFNS